MTFLNHKIPVTSRTGTPGRKLRKRLSHSPAPAGDLHDVHFEPCLRQERKALCAWSEGAGTERERPATGYSNQALASELPRQPQHRNPHHHKPADFERAGHRTDAEWGWREVARQAPSHLTGARRNFP